MPLEKKKVLISLALIGIILQTNTLASEAQGVFNNLDIIMDSANTPSPQKSSMVSARDVRLNGSTLAGGITAGREIHARNCHIGGPLKAGRDIYLQDCASVNEVMAGRSASITGTSALGMVTTGRGLTLINSQLQKNAIAGGDVILENSAIVGQLKTGASHLLLDASQVGSIQVFGHEVAANNNSMIASGNTIIRRKGNMNISVGNTGISSVNGYTVKGGQGQTTVITPDNVIYANGKKVSGKGPKTYAEFRQQTPSAPFVQGPGWHDTGEHSASSIEADSTQAHLPLKVVELKNTSHVKGNIVFEGTRGKVIIHGDSSITGQVFGGEVEHLSN